MTRCHHLFGGTPIKHLNTETLCLAGIIALVVSFLALGADVFLDIGGSSSEHLRLDVGLLLLAGVALGLLLLAIARLSARRYRREAARRRVAEQLAHRSARHDSLTGLPNRRLLTERITKALRRAGDGNVRCAVLFIDLDGFKPVNDRLGHAAGDRVLVEIAGRLRQEVHEGQSVARLGGDEFAVLIEYRGADKELALAARRILRDIQRPITLSEATVEVNATIGIAVGPENGRCAEDLIHAADLAMYDGKEAGRGTFRLSSAA